VAAFTTPEAAARGDIPERYAPVAAVGIAEDGWEPGAGGNSLGCQACFEVGERTWRSYLVEQAPPDATRARIVWSGREQIVAVVDGWVAFVSPYDVPEPGDDPSVVEWLGAASGQTATP
jgi:hypothetical protein